MGYTGRPLRSAGLVSPPGNQRPPIASTAHHHSPTSSCDSRCSSLLSLDGWYDSRSTCKCKRWCTYLCIAILSIALGASAGLYFGRKLVITAKTKPPREFRGEFRIFGGDAWLEKLNNKTSREFLDRKKLYEEDINRVFMESPLKSAYSRSEVLHLSRSEEEGGGVKVKFNLKVDNEKAAIDAGDLYMILADAVSQGSLAGKRIDLHSIRLEEQSGDTTKENNKEEEKDGISEESSAEAETVCKPTILKQCPNNYTSYPNLLNQNQATVLSLIQGYQALMKSDCHSLIKSVICSMVQPSCGKTKKLLPPCKPLCEEVVRHCGGNLNCGNLDENKYCMPKPACKVVVEGDRRCDGVIDCSDLEDEVGCSYCQDKGGIHCGAGSSCVLHHQRCDGRVDCANARDELRCLRLLDDRGSDYASEGRVILEEKGKIGRLCLQNYTTTRMAHGLAESVCASIGYKHVDQTTIVFEGRLKTSKTDVLYVTPTEPLGSVGRTQPELSLVWTKDCPSKKSLAIKCSTLECGQRVAAVRREALPAEAIAQLAARRETTRMFPGDWPWHASLFREDHHRCDAALLNPLWLLTSSHCFLGQSKARWVARLGSTRVLGEGGPWLQERGVIGLVRSPVEASTLVLVKLQDPLNMSDFVRPVCIDMQPEDIPTQTLCFSLGWSSRRELRALPLIVTDISACENISVVSVNTICAVSPKPSSLSCPGEDMPGAPLLCQIGGPGSPWHVVGVSETRTSCKSPVFQPRIFNPVFSNQRWIKKTIEAISLVT